MQYIGRIDDQVKIRGFRIELGEIEHQLGQCGGVESAMVLAQAGQGSDKQLVAYVKLAEAAAPELSEQEQIRNYQERLLAFVPEYMVPKVFVFIQQWPLTPNGKIDKKALSALNATLLQQEYIAPETETEKALVEICARLLNVAAEKISASANFFDLGGHSLLSIKLLAEIQNRFHVELAVAQVFDHAVVSELAKLIDEKSSECGLQKRYQQITKRTDEQVEELVI